MEWKGGREEVAVRKGEKKRRERMNLTRRDIRREGRKKGKKGKHQHNKE